MLGVHACTLTPNPGTGVQPRGHNGNVLKRLFSFRLYEPLTCHLICLKSNKDISVHIMKSIYESFATVGEIRVWWRADFQSGSRVLKKVF